MADNHETSRSFTLPQPQSPDWTKYRRGKSYSSLASDEIELVEPNEFTTRLRKRNLYFGHSQTQSRPDDVRHSSVQEKSWRLLRRRLMTRLLPGVLILGLLCLLVLMTIYPGLFFGNNGGACNPDGDFEISYSLYTPWKSSGVFAINIKIGSLTFWQAKFLDVAWDVVVGRGGQAFLAIFTYTVFTNALTRTMETSSVPHDTYKAITLQIDTAWGLFLLVKNLPRTGDRRAKGALIWTIVSASFVLLFPTWLSAMTGYVADINPYVSLPDNTIVPISMFQPLIYTIHDGARLGDPYSTDTPVCADWGEQTGYLDPANVYECYPIGLRINATTGSLSSYFSSDQCLLVWAVSKYVFEYGFLGLNKTNSTFQLPTGTGSTKPVTLDSPSLNISAHLMFVKGVGSRVGLYDRYSSSNNDNSSWNARPYGQYWKRPNTDQYTFQDNTPILYDDESKTQYTPEAMKDNGACQQTPGIVRYQWGFSFLLLYTFVITLIVWVIGLWILYFDSLLHSRLHERAMGYERAALDLAQSMQAKVPIREAEACSNNELQEFTRDNQISFAEIAPNTSGLTRWMKFRRDHSFRKWVYDEKWWLAALLVFTLFWILSFFLLPFAETGVYTYGMVPGSGIFCVLLVGRETYGRWTLFAVPFIVFVVLLGLSAAHLIF